MRVTQAIHPLDQHRYAATAVGDVITTHLRGRDWQTTVQAVTREGDDLRLELGFSAEDMAALETILAASAQGASAVKPVVGTVWAF